MNSEDFHGIGKYKLVLLLVFVVTWIVMLVGPIHLPGIYMVYVTAIRLFILIRFFEMTLTIMIALYRTYQTLGINKSTTHEQTSIVSFSELIKHQPLRNFHCFIIPSYRQDASLLSETINKLAQNPTAFTNTLVMLAMEAHEQQSEEKAKSLLAKHQNQFRYMGYTVHQLREHEQRNKASNVSWCMEQLEQIFVRVGIVSESVMLTMIDSDTWVPAQYITEIQRYLDERPEEMHSSLFAPPHIFCRNDLDVPVFTRVYDNMQSTAQLFTLMSPFGLLFPMSSYSLSFNLAKEIGFLDTCEDATSDDIHIMLKSFWKTGGRVKGIPIFTPFSQLNVQTGSNYIDNVRVKFWQTARHAQCMTEVAYAILMIQKTKLFTVRSVMLLLKTIDIYVSLMVLGQYAASYCWWPLMKLLGNVFETDSMLPWETLLFVLSWTINVIGFGMYEVFRSYSMRKLYGSQRNDIIRRAIESPIAMAINTFLITIPTMAVALVSAFMKGKQFHVSEKKLNE